jgi:hypothetical protein
MPTTVDIYIGNNKYVTFDEESINEFVKRYEEAKQLKSSFFFFEGNRYELDPDYAIYVIQYVSSVLEINDLIKKYPI